MRYKTLRSQGAPSIAELYRIALKRTRDPQRARALVEAYLGGTSRLLPLKKRNPLTQHERMLLTRRAQTWWAKSARRGGWKKSRGAFLQGRGDEAHRLAVMGKVTRGMVDRPNPGRSDEVDADAARELELFIDNDADLYRQRYKPILKNLMLKRAKGIFDPALAAKVFMYLMDNGARKYIAQYSAPGQRIDEVFNRATRWWLAEQYVKSFIVEADLGNYDHLLLRMTPKQSAARGASDVVADMEAWQEGFRYKLVPIRAGIAPRYAKTLNEIATLRREWPDIKFKVVTMVPPRANPNANPRRLTDAEYQQRYSEFLNGFTRATGLSRTEADEQWAWWGRQLGRAELLRIERGGFKSGWREGVRFRKEFKENPIQKKYAFAQPNPSALRVGEKVKYSAAFLRSAGMYTGPAGGARGVIMQIKPLGSLMLATVRWDHSAIPAQVNVHNLIRVGRLEATNPKPTRRALSVPEQHQLRIAQKTLRMPDPMVAVLGGPSKAAAREIIRRFTGRVPKGNPRRPISVRLGGPERPLEVRRFVNPDGTTPRGSTGFVHSIGYIAGKVWRVAAAETVGRHWSAIYDAARDVWVKVSPGEQYEQGKVIESFPNPPICNNPAHKGAASGPHKVQVWCGSKRVHESVHASLDDACRTLKRIVDRSPTSCSGRIFVGGDTDIAADTITYNVRARGAWERGPFARVTYVSASGVLGGKVNPLTRKEADDNLQDAAQYIRDAELEFSRRAKKEAAYAAGKAVGIARLVRSYGPDTSWGRALGLRNQAGDIAYQARFTNNPAAYTAQVRRASEQQELARARADMHAAQWWNAAARAWLEGDMRSAQYAERAAQRQPRNNPKMSSRARARLSYWIRELTGRRHPSTRRVLTRAQVIAAAFGKVRREGFRVPRPAANPSLYYVDPQTRTQVAASPKSVAAHGPMVVKVAGRSGFFKKAVVSREVELRDLPANNPLLLTVANPKRRAPKRARSRRGLMTFAQARAWAKKYGLVKEFNKTVALQTRANRRPTHFAIQRIPIGPKKQVLRTVLAHYGNAPESRYIPPAGSKKGDVVYRHKWGEGSRRQRPVPVLATPGGKAIINLMGPGQKTSDWMRG